MRQIVLQAIAEVRHHFLNSEVESLALCLQSIQKLVFGLWLPIVVHVAKRRDLGHDLLGCIFIGFLTFFHGRRFRLLLNDRLLVLNGARVTGFNRDNLVDSLRVVASRFVILFD